MITPEQIEALIARAIANKDNSGYGRLVVFEIDRQVCELLPELARTDPAEANRFLWRLPHRYNSKSEGYAYLAELAATTDPDKAERLAGLIPGPTHRARAYAKIALALRPTDRVRAGQLWSLSLTWHRRQLDADRRITSLAAQAEQAVGIDDDWAIETLKRAVDDLIEIPDLVVRHWSLDDVKKILPTLSQKPEAQAELARVLSSYRAGRQQERRERLEKKRERLEKLLSVTRTAEDIARVKKKASRYRKSGGRILVGAGDDQPEWRNGFEVLDNIAALLAEPEGAAVGRDLGLRSLTRDLKYLKALQIDPKYPDLLDSLERLRIVDQDCSVFDGGAPGGNVCSIKVHINVAIYEQVVDELWVFRDRLADCIWRRLPD